MCLSISFYDCLTRWALDVLRAVSQGNHVAELILSEHLMYLDVLGRARPGGSSEYCCSAHRVWKIRDDVCRGGLNLPVDRLKRSMEMFHQGAYRFAAVIGNLEHARP